jgi:membrane protein YqaA with SNARE-associated domain
MHIPRLTGWLMITIGLLLAIALFQPQQLLVVLYKGALVTLGGVVGYWIGRSLFPYARPHTFIDQFIRRAEGDDATRMVVLAAAALVARSLIVLACILGLTLGL